MEIFLCFLFSVCVVGNLMMYVDRKIREEI
jgi:hypothetical protein